MIVITGWRTTIAQEVRMGLQPWQGPAVQGKPLAPGFPLNASHYLFCQGLLRAKPQSEQTTAEIEESWLVNFLSIRDLCDQIFEIGNARICVIGSESAFRGSYDDVYAAAKRELHNYVSTKRLKGSQQLVAVSPWIISDAGMTTRRLDRQNLELKRQEHPKRRFLTANEVARTAMTLLFGTDFISGTVVRMHGGLPE